MRVVVVEDQDLLREAVTAGLVARGIDVAATAVSVADAVPAVRACRPDAVLLDIRLPPTFRDEGLQIAEQVHRELPSVGLLVLSSHDDVEAAERLLGIGEEVRGIGYLLKERVGALAELEAALRRVAAGEVVIDPRIVRRLMDVRQGPDPLGVLTPHERRVLALLAEGRSNLGIADELGSKVGTVEKHVSVIAEKLGLAKAHEGGRRYVNTRVMAALTYLRTAADGSPG